MIKKIEGEKWKTLAFHKAATGKFYAISNNGRLSCFTKKPLDGTLVKGSLQEGYSIWRFKKRNRNGSIVHMGILLHRLVAEYFSPHPHKGKTVVIHHDHKKTNNHYSNLAWATIAEASVHAQASPRVKKARRLAREKGGAPNSKLTEGKVKAIKTLLGNGKTLKELAVKFGVSDMQIYRIKTGENWGHLN
jgi:HNH endonuclease